MATAKKIISKSDLARLLSCSASSISALVKRGLPHRKDGMLDRMASLRWIAKQASGRGGGWGASGRGQDLQRRAAALLAADPGEAAAPVAPTPQLPPAPSGATTEAPASNRHQIRVEVVHELLEPARQLRIARACVVAGCTPAQAVAIALAINCAVADLPDITAEDISCSGNPSDKEFAAAVGAFDEAEVDELLRRVLVAVGL